MVGPHLVVYGTDRGAGRLEWLDRATGASVRRHELRDEIWDIASCAGRLFAMRSEHGHRNGERVRLTDPPQIDVYAGPGELVGAIPVPSGSGPMKVAGDVLLVPVHSPPSTLAFRASTGERLWAIAAAYLAHDREHVVLDDAGAIVLARLADGQEAWRRPALCGAEAAPLGAIEGDLVVVSDHDGAKLFGLERQTGKERWSRPLKGGRYGVDPVTPVVLPTCVVREGDKRKLVAYARANGAELGVAADRTERGIDSGCAVVPGSPLLLVLSDQTEGKGAILAFEITA